MPTTTPEEGEMAALVIVGAVFCTETSAEELAVALDESVAVGGAGYGGSDTCVGRGYRVGG